jgi:DNA invertase Pin-like site-specific DNA recombinase
MLDRHGVKESSSCQDSRRWPKISTPYAGVDFVAADMPDANRMTVGIMAIIAEHERDAISTRTKQALAAAKARGTKLGNPVNLTLASAALGRKMGNAANTDRARKRLIDLEPVIRSIRDEGMSSLGRIAAGLNERRIPAARGGKWAPVQVSRVLARMSLGSVTEGPHSF